MCPYHEPENMKRCCSRKYSASRHGIEGSGYSTARACLSGTPIINVSAGASDRKVLSWDALRHNGNSIPAANSMTIGLAMSIAVRRNGAISSTMSNHKVKTENQKSKL